MYPEPNFFLFWVFELNIEQTDANGLNVWPALAFKNH